MTRALTGAPSHLRIYWDTKHNRVIVFAKMVTGKTFDDSIEGRIRV